MRLRGQLRYVAGMAAAVATGWDMTAALALGRAAGVPDQAMAEFLPEIEPVAVQQVNARMAGSDV